MPGEQAIARGPSASRLRPKLIRHGDEPDAAKLLARDGAAGDEFGISVSISGDVAVVGAIFENGVDTGSAYLFALDCTAACTRDPIWLCDGDVDGGGQVNTVDSGLVQAASCTGEDFAEDGLCQYDLDCDNQINPVDAGVVQSLFGTCNPPQAVCP